MFVYIVYSDEVICFNDIANSHRVKITVGFSYIYAFVTYFSYKAFYSIDAMPSEMACGYAKAFRIGYVGCRSYRVETKTTAHPCPFLDHP